MLRTVELTLDDVLVDERDAAELVRAMHQGLVLLDYLQTRISLGKFAELMDMEIEEAQSWLYQRGIATTRRFLDPELQAACEANYRDLARSLNITLPA